MTKKNIMPVVVLTAICVVVAALLGVVNMFTAPIIEEAEAQKVYDSFRVVLDGTFAETDIPDGASDSVTAVYKVTDEGGALKGHVVTVVVKGYAGNISVTVGVDADGKVTKAVVTNSAETHGKSGMSTYTDNFAGKNAEEVAGVDTFSGATISSTAIRGAVLDAVNAITGGGASAPDTETGGDATDEPEVLPKTDAEIVALGKELVDGSSELTEVSLWSKPDTLKRLYSVPDNGYVAYIVVPGDYVPVATEALVHINPDGDIEGISLLSWVVGHGTDPGTFADGFVGKDNWHIDEVELVSGSTGTSGDFRVAVQDTMTTVSALLERTDKKLLELVDELVPNSKSFELIELPADAPSTLKRIYKETSDKGSVAYIVVPGEYVAVATEALVYFDGAGKIQDINLLTWTVGHGVEPGSFASGFIGKTEKDIGEVELVTSATTTSADLRNAVEAAFPYVPVSNAPMITGIVIAALALVATVVAVIISKKRRTVK